MILFIFVYKGFYELVPFNCGSELSGSKVVGVDRSLYYSTNIRKNWTSYYTRRPLVRVKEDCFAKEGQAFALLVLIFQNLVDQLCLV